MFKKIKLGIISFLCSFSLISCDMSGLFPDLDDTEEIDNGKVQEETSKKTDTKEDSKEDSKSDTKEDDKQPIDTNPDNPDPKIPEDQGDQDDKPDNPSDEDPIDPNPDDEDPVEEDTTIPVTEIQITTNKDIILLVGDKLQLDYSISPVNATYPNVVWSVYSGDAVTVSNTGVLTAVKVGSSTIVRATAHNGKYGQYSVTVRESRPLQSIQFTQQTYYFTFSPGATNALTNTFSLEDRMTLNPKDAVIRNKDNKLSVLSSNTSVCASKFSTYYWTPWQKKYGLDIKNVGETEITVYEDKNNNGQLDPSEVREKFKLISKEKEQAPITHTVEAEIINLKTEQNYLGTKSPDSYSKDTAQIYYMSEKGDVPYIDLSQMTKIYKAATGSDGFCTVKQIDEDTYNFTRSAEKYSGSDAYITFDVANQRVVAPEWNKYLNGLYGNNNGQFGDIGTPVGMVQTSDKTKVITAGKSVTFDLAKYDMKIYGYDDKLYLPFNLACKFAFGDANTMIFDGSLIYPQDLVVAQDSAYFYANTNSFLFDVYDTLTYSKQIPYSKFTLKEKTPTESGVVREFADEYNHFDGSSSYKIYGNLKLKDDNSASFVSGQIFSSGSKTEMINQDFSYTSQQYKSGTLITLNSTNKKRYIYLRNSKYNINYFQTGMKEFNYNFLCFQLDYFYGLKDDLKISSFDTYFKNTSQTIRFVNDTNNGITTKTNNLYNFIFGSNNIEEYSYIMRYILCNVLGDGHTNIAQHTKYTKESYARQNIFDALNYSDRLITLSNKGSTYSQARTKAGTGTQVDIYSNDTAVIRFDSFTGSTVSNGEKYTSYENYAGSNYSKYIASDTFRVIGGQMSLLSKNTSIKKIVFDVTCNGGGTVFTIPLLMAFMTKDPAITVKNLVDGSVIEYHYKVDLNGDKTYAGDADTFAGKYSFYILTSAYSFSCGTLFPTCCKNVGCAKIIGEKSGGGGCPVGYATDAFGTSFQISQSRLALVKSGSNYISNDAGVPLDYAVDSSNWYNSNLRGQLK